MPQIQPSNYIFYTSSQQTIQSNSNYVKSKLKEILSNNSRINYPETSEDISHSNISNKPLHFWATI